MSVHTQPILSTAARKPRKSMLITWLMRSPVKFLIVSTVSLGPPYAYGGPKLTVETIKNFTGLRINHVINIDFRGFRAAVDKIGCVWTDIDRHYFNQNSG